MGSPNPSLTASCTARVAPPAMHLDGRDKTADRHPLSKVPIPCSAVNFGVRDFGVLVGEGIEIEARGDNLARKALQRLDLRGREPEPRQPIGTRFGDGRWRDRIEGRSQTLPRLRWRWRSKACCAQTIATIPAKPDSRRRSPGTPVAATIGAKRLSSATRRATPFFRSAWVSRRKTIIAKLSRPSPHFKNRQYCKNEHILQRARWHLCKRQKKVAIRTEHRAYGLISSHMPAIRNDAASPRRACQKRGLGSDNTSVQASDMKLRVASFRTCQNLG